MPSDLTGKRLIITGAATGIGRSTAILAAQSGAQVIAIFDIDDAAAQEVASIINKLSPPTAARYWHVDVSGRASVEGSVSAAVQWLSRVDVLLHFAGIMDGAFTPIDSFEEPTWDRVIDINLKGTYLVAKACVALHERSAQRRSHHQHRIWRRCNRRIVLIRLRSIQRRSPRLHHGHATTHRHVQDSASKTSCQAASAPARHRKPPPAIRENRRPSPLRI